MNITTLTLAHLQSHLQFAFFLFPAPLSQNLGTCHPIFPTHQPSFDSVWPRVIICTNALYRNTFILPNTNAISTTYHSQPGMLGSQSRHRTRWRSSTNRPGRQSSPCSRRIRELATRTSKPNLLQNSYHPQRFCKGRKRGKRTPMGAAYILPHHPLRQRRCSTDLTRTGDCMSRHGKRGGGRVCGGASRQIPSLVLPVPPTLPQHARPALIRRQEASPFPGCSTVSLDHP